MMAIRSVSALFLILLFASVSAAEHKEVAGWIENVALYPGKVMLKAKLDTGAKTSSLNAPHYKTFTREGESWVRFDVENKEGKKVRIEKKVIRDARIKRKNMPPKERPVIMLGLCMGKVFKEVEVNLEDRSNHIYQLLIGRNFLKGSYIVDPAITFTTKPDCKTLPSQ
jgi:hypothetical protein